MVDDVTPAVESDLDDVRVPAAPTGPLSVDQSVMGLRFSPQVQLLVYSEDEWEVFVEEWAYACLKNIYHKVKRFSGAGDKGVDVAGFCDLNGLQGIWDNYQCKHYDHALYPSDAWKEIGKMLWYSYNGDFKPPRRYYFVAPMGVGTTLNALLSDPAALKKQLRENWDKNCKDEIKKGAVPLEGDFEKYFEKFDFSIFDAKTGPELVDDHRQTPYFAARFGGGLPDRPEPTPPPDEISIEESRYVEQLLQAYADHTKGDIADISQLKKEWKKLHEHFLRQRTSFYRAESLRVFARASVPAGTFESFQEEILSGVIDHCESDHADGYARVRAVMEAARVLQMTSNALLTRAKLQDRDGICHQLANEDRLLWVP